MDKPDRPLPGSCGFESHGEHLWRVAQSVAQAALNRKVGGSTPPSPARNLQQLPRRLAPRRSDGFTPRRAGFDSLGADCGRSSTVRAPGCGPGDGGSIPLGHPNRGWSNGKTAGFGPADQGSKPWPRTIEDHRSPAGAGPPFIRAAGQDRHLGERLREGGRHLVGAHNPAESGSAPGPATIGEGAGRRRFSHDRLGGFEPHLLHSRLSGGGHADVMQRRHAGLRPRCRCEPACRCNSCHRHSPGPRARTNLHRPLARCRHS
jgi:hypothetical protein